MRTVLHIGMNKTGSTSLQTALYKNRRVMRSAGVLYPKSGCGTEGNSYLYHYDLSRLLGFANLPASAQQDAAELQILRRDLLAEVSDAAPDTLIFSSEYFCLRRKLSRVKDFFYGHDLTIVAYLRRHDFWYASLYAQAVKTVPGLFPWKPGFPGYVEWLENHPDLFGRHGEMLDAWREAFPDARIVARPLVADLRRPADNSQSAENMLQDFFDSIGNPMPRGLERFGVRHDNRSPGPIQVQKEELQRRREEGWVGKPFVIQPQLVTLELSNRLKALHRDDYRYVADRYATSGDRSLSAWIAE